MNITKRDIAETQFVGRLIQQVDNIGFGEANNISGRIVENQPFIMSLLIGYKFDVKKEQLDGIMKMLFVIYLFFEQKADVKKRKIGPIEFEETQKRNVQFLKYFSGENSNKGQIEANKQYLSNLRFKSLFTGIIAMSKNKNSLNKLNAD